MERRGGKAIRRWGTAVIASAAVLSVAAPTATAQAAQAASGPSGVSAKGAYLLDNGTNKKLWSRAADTKRPMASTTKLMTAVVVLDTRGVNLAKKVTVKQSYIDYTASVGGSKADLKKGDKLTVKQLLYGLLLPSGCDAAMALADTFGTGDTTAKRTKSFIAQMNKKASALGMTKTHYDTFDGISQGGQNYTTPRDMTKLARHALGNSTLGTVVKSVDTIQKAPAANGRTRTYYWNNTNRLLGSYSGAIGIKTGTGTAPGRCLVFAAKRNGRTVVGVILNAPKRYPDAKKMLDWAFQAQTKVTWRQLPKGTPED
ncbi:MULTISPECIES: D-alanyl-D-alanine carboxypeptidase family protein [Streptomyces]|uniref:D-alanyl-D-alanine carboxypeptidase (Penicillin-binding protein 5/6) n=1 Tax=Streptomyces demainii TaxID=588122 RepID=A0ABT9KVV9_9ACTN|nr:MULTISPECIES: serine hydrolase [Streptomyces]MBW8092924.1 D-alanyl-D-alanine carboxypeptidase [Streptomyces hygroscopicus subsp. hygroscopicus]MDN3054502.1 serine hydrolase [Streptomyces sp. SRF1]MDP9611511.1 D-alanyl-D-alanine carboxypeptidase (penicillin-binding protein 5/6) [Streptomyces demainii]